MEGRRTHGRFVAFEFDPVSLRGAFVSSARPAGRGARGRAMSPGETHRRITSRMLAIYDELFAHDGYAGFRVEIRILRRGQKEVILDCGKQYRFVVDFDPAARKPAEGGS
jgi:hypothetical protein